MTDYEVDQLLGYSPCVCGVLDGTWHTKCYQGKTRAQLDEGQKNAYAVARRQLKNKVAEESNRAINLAMSRTGASMIKWPEPVGGAYVRTFQSARETKTEWIDKVYTEAQLKQAVRDALEEAAKVAQETVCDTHIPTGINIYGTRAAKAIRALIKQGGQHD